MAEDNMVKVYIIDREGVKHELEAPTDMSMNIMAMCATCQCYLESETDLDEQSDGELDMLDEAFFVEDNSRLGCQIPITDAIDGIVLRLAPEGN